MSDNNDFASFVFGFLVGAVAGGITALMLAPQSGEETRTVIKDKAIELSDKATETVDDAYARLEDSLGKAQVQVEELTKVAKEKATELQEKGKTIYEEQKSKIAKKPADAGDEAAEPEAA
jgi:gas vesicle protein